MKKADPELPKLTENDKKVLKQIIEHAKIPDSRIAEDIGISPQAVYKIRSKLEDLGIIKGYIPIIDFKKIGIRIMVLLIFRIKEEVWDDYTDEVVSERIAKMPYVISAYRVADAQASHVLLIGFRDNEQKERFIAQMQIKYAGDLEIKDVYTFSVEKIITQNPMGLLYEAIDKNDYTSYELFPQRKKT